MERQIHSELFRITPDGELQEVGYITYQFEPETFFVGLTNQAVYAHQAHEHRRQFHLRRGGDALGVQRIDRNGDRGQVV